MEQMPTRAKTRMWIIVGVCAVAALVPIPYLAAPKWQVWVVDGFGAPVEGMTVRRVYQNYSTEGEGHEEDQTTDKQGHASFSPRWSSASVTRRVIFTVLAARAGVHAGFGRHSYVFAFGRGMEAYAVSGQYVLDWTGSPAELKTRITATARQ
jgi:hypothetical protein